MIESKGLDIHGVKIDKKHLEKVRAYKKRQWASRYFEEKYMKGGKDETVKGD